MVKEKEYSSGVLSYNNFAMFMQVNGKNKKHITHTPNYPIPLMTVNEDNEAFTLFNTYTVFYKIP